MGLGGILTQVSATPGDTQEIIRRLFLGRHWLGRGCWLRICRCAFELRIRAARLAGNVVRGILLIVVETHVARRAIEAWPTFRGAMIGWGAAGATPSGCPRARSAGPTGIYMYPHEPAARVEPSQRHDHSSVEEAER